MLNLILRSQRIILFLGCSFWKMSYHFINIDAENVLNIYSMNEGSHATRAQKFLFWLLFKKSCFHLIIIIIHFVYVESEWQRGESVGSSCTFDLIFHLFDVDLCELDCDRIVCNNTKSWFKNIYKIYVYNIVLL